MAAAVFKAFSKRTFYARAKGGSERVACGFRVVAAAPARETARQPGLDVLFRRSVKPRFKPALKFLSKSSSKLLFRPVAKSIFKPLAGPGYLGSGLGWSKGHSSPLSLPHSLSDSPG